MGFTYQELKRTKENTIVWEKQENIEIKQNSLGLFKKKHSLIKQRFISKPTKKVIAKNDNNKEKLKKEVSTDISIPTKIVLHTLEEQQEFVEKLEYTKQHLDNLKETINYEIKSLQQPGYDKVKENNDSMEKNKKGKLKESTWGDFLASGNGKKQELGDIAKERYSLQHQCVCTSPRYSSDKNLALRPKMRSVASQVSAGEEFIDQGAVGDHNNLKDLKSLHNLKDKNIGTGYQNHPVVNCCYGLTNQPPRPHYENTTTATNGVQCQHYNYQQRGLQNNREYNYCHEEYYYNSANCNCPKTNPTCCQNPANTTAHYRRQSTDLNTQHFYSRPEDKNCYPERHTNSKSKRKKELKTDKSKSKESNEEYNERKKRECEQRLDKLKERTSKRQSSNSAENNEKYLTKTQKLKKLLKEENALKLIKHLDQYVEEHEKQLSEDFKKFQYKEDSCSSEPNTTLKIRSAEKYCQVKIRKNKKINNKSQLEVNGDSSLETQYSLATLQMLKKMTIREYKPLKTLEERQDKSKFLVRNDLSKLRLEKCKNYQEYVDKFEKEKEVNKSLQILKSPPSSKEENEVFHKITESFIDSPRYPKQVTREQLESLRPTFSEISIISPRAQEQYLIPRGQKTKAREQLGKEQRVYKDSQHTLRAKTNNRSKPVTPTESESYEDFRYEYGADDRVKKTWDDYGKYKEQNELNNGNYNEEESISQNSKATKSLKENKSLEDFPKRTTQTNRETKQRYGHEEKAGLADYIEKYIKETFGIGKDKRDKGYTQEDMIEKQSLKYYEDKRKDFQEEEEKKEIKTPKLKYFEGKREDSEEQTLNYYEHKSEYQSPKYYEEKGRDTLGAKLATKDQQSSEYYEDKRRDLLGERQTLSDQQSLKHYNDKKGYIREENEEPKLKYYTDTKKDSRDRRQPAVDEQKFKYYEHQREDQSPKYYENRIRDSLIENQAASRESSFSYYKYKRRETSPTLTEQQRYKYYEPKRNEQSSNYYVDEANDFLEEIHPTTSETKSKYFKNKIRDSLDVRQPATNKQRKPQSKQEIDMNYEFPSCSKTKKSADYNYEPSKMAQENEDLYPRDIETQKYAQKLATDDHIKYKREEEESATKTLLEKEILAQAQDIKREFKTSPRKFLYKEDNKELPSTKHQKEIQEYPLKQEDLKPQMFSKQNESFYPQELQSFNYDNVSEKDKKSQTSSYRDFKQVMDQNLGFYTNRHSQTDYNLGPEISKKFSTQTFNKQTTGEFEEAQPVSSPIPNTTEEALSFLKNFIESSPKLGLEGECLNSVTLAAKDLITKLSSCQSSLQTETMINAEQSKSSEDLTNYNLEEKSTPDTQYKDLETTTDSSENQLRKPLNEKGFNFITQSEVESPESFQIYGIPEMPKEPEDFNFQQQESYHYQTQIDPQNCQSIETYQSCWKSKENINSLQPPPDFMDEQQSLQPNLPQNTSLHPQDPLNVEIPLVYQPFFESNGLYRPLPSSRRPTAFDPDLVPLKGILKSCRVKDNAETLSCDLLAQKTTSMVSFGHRDEINIQKESSLICQRGQEEIAQQFNETQEIIITKDETLQPINEQSKHMLTAQTSSTLIPICQDCLQKSQGNCTIFNENISYTPVTIPPFKQCPCMLKTYRKMLTNYYKEKINKKY